MLLIYILVSVLFGLNAIIQQYFRYPETDCWCKYVLVFLLNTIGFPICLVIALINKTLIPKNLIKALKDQGPLKRAYKNFFVTGNAWGLFHKNSHLRADTGLAKVSYNTKKSAVKASEAMSMKYGNHYSVYKCAFCDGYHIGRNRDNK